MAEERAAQDRTEDPTPRRLEEARRRGDLPISREIGAALGLVAAWAILTLAGADLGSALAQALRTPLERADMPLVGDRLTRLLAWLAGRAALACAPLLGLLLLIGPVALALQNGLTLAPARLRPRLARLSPRAGVLRLLGPASLGQLAIGLAKLAIVAGAASWAGTSLVALVPAMPTLAPAVAALGASLSRLLGAVALAGAMIAAADLAWHRFAWRRRLRMTRSELREELRHSDGNPEVKAKLRRLRQQRSRRRMMAAVPRATVVITNPTHLAVALAYDRATMRAPRCVAKGQDELARRIREVAQAHRVPVIEHRPLARLLHAGVEIDQEIPAEHYRAVAEIISYVLTLQRRG